MMEIILGKGIICLLRLLKYKLIYSHVPKPVFHMNGKSKLNSQRHQIQEVITPQHEELIKFVYECKYF